MCLRPEEGGRGRREERNRVTVGEARRRAEEVRYRAGMPVRGGGPMQRILNEDAPRVLGWRPKKDKELVMPTRRKLREDGKLAHGEMYTHREAMPEAQATQVEMVESVQSGEEGEDRAHEKKKKRKYNERVLDVENGTFTQLVFSVFGGWGMNVKCFISNYASCCRRRRVKA